MDTRERQIYKTTLVGTAVNALLILAKFIAGTVGRSSALIADAVHSLSDFITDIIVLVFVKLADKPRDKGHDYGHGKFETLATMVIGVILIIAGLGLMADGIDHVVRALRGEQLPSPTWIALCIAILSILSKEWLYRYTLAAGRRLRSQAVAANAWHHRSDAISSLGTLVGIAGAMFLGPHWRILDPIAAVIVSLFIIKSGYDIMKPSISELLEASLPDDQEHEILSLVKNVPGVLGVMNLRTRRIGNEIAVDLKAIMDGRQTLASAHAIAHKAEDAIKNRFGEKSIVTIHMEPYDPEKAHADQDRQQ